MGCARATDFRMRTPAHALLQRLELYRTSLLGTQSEIPF